MWILFDDSGFSARSRAWRTTRNCSAPATRTELDRDSEGRTMFGLSLLTVPAIAAVSVFVIALLAGENVVIEKINVPYQLQWSGYNSDVTTRQFVDAMRELNEGAASELADLEIDPTNLQEGLGRFEDYFQISVLVNGARNILGLIPYYVEGEIAEVRGEEVLTIR